MDILLLYITDFSLTGFLCKFFSCNFSAFRCSIMINILLKINLLFLMEKGDGIYFVVFPHSYDIYEVKGSLD